MATTGSCTASSEPVPLDDKRKLKVSIANTPAHTSALQLLLLWRPNLGSGKPVPAAAPIVDDPRPEPTPPDVEPAPLPNPPPAPRPVPPGWVALSEYEPPPRTPCPATIRFWDGSEQALKYWYEILTGVVKRLHSEGRLTVKDVPIGWGPKVYRRTYGAGSPLRQRIQKCQTG